jgi:hypothetical protein
LNILPPLLPKRITGKGTNIRVNTTDLYLIHTRTTHTTDLLPKATTPKTHTVDLLPHTGGTEVITHTADMVLKKLSNTKTHTTDLISKATQTETHTTDIDLIKKWYTYTTDLVSNQIKRVNFATGSTSITGSQINITLNTSINNAIVVGAFYRGGGSPRLFPNVASITDTVGSVYTRGILNPDVVGYPYTSIELWSALSAGTNSSNIITLNLNTSMAYLTDYGAIAVQYSGVENPIYNSSPTFGLVSSQAAEPDSVEPVLLGPFNVTVITPLVNYVSGNSWQSGFIELIPSSSTNIPITPSHAVAQGFIASIGNLPSIKVAIGDVATIVVAVSGGSFGAVSTITDSLGNSYNHSGDDIFGTDVISIWTSTITSPGFAVITVNLNTASSFAVAVSTYSGVQTIGALQLGIGGSSSPINCNQFGIQPTSAPGIHYFVGFGGINSSTPFGQIASYSIRASASSSGISAVIIDGTGVSTVDSSTIELGFVTTATGSSSVGNSISFGQYSGSVIFSGSTPLTNPNTGIWFAAIDNIITSTSNTNVAINISPATGSNRYITAEIQILPHKRHTFTNTHIVDMLLGSITRTSKIHTADLIRKALGETKTHTVDIKPTRIQTHIIDLYSVRTKSHTTDMIIGAPSVGVPMALTIAAFTSSITVGQNVQMTGSLIRLDLNSGLPNQYIWLQTSPDNINWTTTGNSPFITNSSGNYIGNITYNQSGSIYTRASFSGSVLTTLSAVASPTTIVTNGNVSVTGSLIRADTSLPLSSQIIAIQTGTSPSSLTTALTTNTGISGNYSGSVSFPSIGTDYIQSLYTGSTQGSPEFQLSQSPVSTITVTGSSAGLPAIQTIVFVAMSDTSINTITSTQAASAPYMNNTLIPSSAFINNYNSIGSPGLPNYMAWTGAYDYFEGFDVNPRLGTAAWGEIVKVVDTGSDAGANVDSTYWSTTAASPSTCTITGGQEISNLIQTGTSLVYAGIAHPLASLINETTNLNVDYLSTKIILNTYNISSPTSNEDDIYLGLYFYFPNGPVTGTIQVGTSQWIDGQFQIQHLNNGTFDAVQQYGSFFTGAVGTERFGYREVLNAGTVLVTGSIGQPGGQASTIIVANLDVYAFLARCLAFLGIPATTPCYLIRLEVEQEGFGVNTVQFTAPYATVKATGSNINNIFDLIENSGRTWRAYAQDYPGTSASTTLTDGDNTSSGNNYVEHHFPPAYFNNIRNNSARIPNIYRAGTNAAGTNISSGFSQFFSDISGSNPPNFMWVTPNNTNNGHDGSGTSTAVANADNFLKTFVPAVTSSPVFASGKGVLIISWDQPDTSGNPVGFLMAGQRINPGKYGFGTSPTYIRDDGTTGVNAPNHASLMRTIEDIWSMPRLGINDSAAISFSGSSVGIFKT